MIYKLLFPIQEDENFREIVEPVFEEVRLNSTGWWSEIDVLNNTETMYVDLEKFPVDIYTLVHNESGLPKNLFKILNFVISHKVYDFQMKRKSQGDDYDESEEIKLIKFVTKTY